MKALRRMYLPFPEPGACVVELDTSRRHYVLHVLRLAEGDALEVFDGHGRACMARLESGARLKLSESQQSARSRPVTILQGLPKGEKLEWVLQKGTELGAAAFVATAAQRSVVKLSAERGDERIRRWRKILEESARQCGRNDVPGVALAASWEDAGGTLAPGTRVLILDEGERATRLGPAVSKGAPGQPLALVVGPEGGLERMEVEGWVARGAEPVSLGTAVLRTETAALAALAIIRHRDGELG
jgi:16S rRNA (uracil1498-N3)-methyltransferase